MAEESGLQPLVIDDLSGGKTDFFLGGDPRQARVIDNFVITENKDLDVRPGSRSPYNFRISASDTIRKIIFHDEEILLGANKKITYQTTAANSILSENSHTVFTRGDDDTPLTSAFFNDHSLLSNDGLNSLRKVYKNEAGAWKTTTLGLPSIYYIVARNLANEIKSDFNSHIVDTGEHSSAGTNLITSEDASDLSSLVSLTNEIERKYIAHFDNSGIHPGAVTAGDAYTAQTPQSAFTCYQALKEIKTKFNSHDNDSTAHTLGGGSHQVSALSDFSGSGTAGANSYIYAFFLIYRYDVEGVQFIERGEPYFIEVSSVNAPDTNSITLTTPNIESGTYENWDDSNVKLVVARSVNGGNTFFHVDEQVADGTSFIDSTSDSALGNNTVAYFEGELPDEMPPPAKFITLLSDTLVLAAPKIGDTIRGNILRQCKPSKPFSAPAGFETEFESDLVGIGKISSYVIAFLSDKVYRVEGGFDSQGRGNVVKRLITDQVGSINHECIVNTKNGVYFASEDGFYVTDGFNFRKISLDINETYEAFINKGNIKGSFDKKNNRILWSVHEESGLAQNDKIYVCHLNFQTIRNGHPFTTWSGGRDAANFLSTALGYFGGSIYRADPNGYLLEHSASFDDDVSVDNNILPDSWITQTIFYDWESVGIDFGSSQLRKWVSKINLNADNDTALHLQMRSANDNSNVFRDLSPVVDESNFVWGDPSVIWGDESLTWNLFPVVSAWRHFPAVFQSIRCMYKHVKLENDNVTLVDSGNLGLATVSNSANTVTLDTAGNEWIPNAGNYIISFASDNYVNEFTISTQTTTELTVLDPNNELIDGSGAWRITGYPKKEKLKLLSLVLSYRTIGMSQEHFRPEGAPE